MDQSASASSSRQDLIRNAVLFLNDPKVQSSTLTSRITFLESKGLTESEIQTALHQASNQSSGSSSGSAFNSAPYERQTGYGHGQMMAPPPPPKRDWRDLFIMAVVSGGVMYGVATLARKYLLPHLQPPSSTAFQSTSESLTEQYDEAAKLLSELTNQTTELQRGIESDRERVNGVVVEVEEAVRAVRDGEERWREELREMREEVEGVRDLVPKMIEKHSQTQSAALADLQSELRSLKTLLIARQQSAVPQSSNSGINGVSSTQAAADALLRPKPGSGKTGIPAWQMAPSSSASSSGSPGGSLSGSGVLEPEKAEGS